MGLRYDFDMVAMTPEGLPDEFGDLALTGIAAEKVAMFRDPDTVAALKSADAAVQTYFTESGFALDQFDSGAPGGYFAQRDEDARIAVIDRLTVDLKDDVASPQACSPRRTTFACVIDQRTARLVQAEARGN
ncbi:MAG: hypothetical protein AAFX89_11435, partial [Pseudomonadota bacterium]